MKDYRIIEIEYSSGRIEYRVDVWLPELSLGVDKQGAQIGYWDIVGHHTTKVEATDHIELMRNRKLDLTVVKETELDAEGKVKGDK